MVVVDATGCGRPKFQHHGSRHTIDRLEKKLFMVSALSANASDRPWY